MRLFERPYLLIVMINDGLFLVNPLVGSVRLRICHLRRFRLDMINGSPSSLREVYITGGLAPMVSSPDEIYMRLFRILHNLITDQRRKSN